MKTKFILLSLITIVSATATADICSTVIQGASLEGYQGRMGGYDGNGLCHIRDISEADCRSYSGHLFYGYSADNGKGFTHCAFTPPAARQGGRAPASESEREMYDRLHKKWCAEAEKTFMDGLKELNSESSTGSIDMWLKNAKETMEKYCPRVGRNNIVTFAGSKYNELMRAARQRDQRKDDEDRKAANDRLADKVERDLKALENWINNGGLKSAEEKCRDQRQATAWCASNASGMSQQKGCFQQPVTTGPDEWSVELNMACTAAMYMGVVAVYDDKGNCTRKVISLSRGSTYKAGVTSDMYQKDPRVIDGIAATTTEIQKCYQLRHEGCACQ